MEVGVASCVGAKADQKYVQCVLLEFTLFRNFIRHSPYKNTLQEGGHFTMNLNYLKMPICVLCTYSVYCTVHV